MERIRERLSESSILKRVRPVLEAARALETGARTKRTMILVDSARILRSYFDGATSS